MPQDDVLARTPSPLLRDPPLAGALLADPRFAWLWLMVRVYLGWQWLQAGWDKLQDPAWAVSGSALQTYWAQALWGAPVASSPAPDWYRGLLQLLLTTQTYSWFAPMLAYSETLGGIALILGAFTGLVAFWGSLLTFNFMLATTASNNPVLFALAVGLMLAWKTAGWIGLDHWLLPLLGTPWRATPTFPRFTPAPSSRVTHRRSLEVT